MKDYFKKYPTLLWLVSILLGVLGMLVNLSTIAFMFGDTNPKIMITLLLIANTCLAFSVLIYTGLYYESYKRMPL